MERRRRWRGDRGDEVARQTLTRTQMSLVAGPTLENCSNDRIFYGISIETERGNITFSQPISFYNPRPFYKPASIIFNTLSTLRFFLRSPLHFFFPSSFSFLFLRRRMRLKREQRHFLDILLYFFSISLSFSLSLQGDKLVSPRR